MLETYSSVYLFDVKSLLSRLTHVV